MNDEHDNAITDAEQLQKLHPLRQPQKATDKAINYLLDLAKSHDYEQALAELPPVWQELFHQIITSPDNPPYAQADVSKFIDLLKSCPRVPKQDTFTGLRGNHPMAQQPLEDGMYRGPKPNEHIYKVYHTVHGANQQVAKRLMVKNMVETSNFTFGQQEVHSAVVSFKYEGKAPLYFLKPSMRLTIEEAQAFGKLYGVCCLCGRTLTNELSIHLGIGPICGRREFGGDWEFMIHNSDLAGKTFAVADTEEEIRARLAEIDAELNPTFQED